MTGPVFTKRRVPLFIFRFLRGSGIIFLIPPMRGEKLMTTDLLLQKNGIPPVNPMGFTRGNKHFDSS